MAAKRRATTRRTSKKAPLTTRRKLRKAAAKATKTAKLGTGTRFKAVEASARASGARINGSK